MPDDSKELLRRDCAGRTLLDHITGKWGIQVLTSLKNGPLRFHQVRALIDGVSDKMLTQTLRTFADDGLVERTVIPTSPPSVVYQLTNLGVEATRELDPFLRWVRRSVAGDAG
ncbi:winged helix-turn-helix transcriptional regulator [Rhodococcoides yunnanense]|uniref:winged helix-turn-helix transcriptional regulator n=1 Tax=Rhodococcoides yunnanense TaxID=278209 RepID=UPI00093473FF|nr:helix-turn-helix domain-containing protein [Rhodococcus yunnanensis]